MSVSQPRNDAITAQGANTGTPRIALIIGSIVVLLALAGGIFYLINENISGGTDKRDANGANARSYRTIAKTEIRAEPNQAARMVVSLREGTTLSGVPAGNRDGVDWLQITAVDGTKGFVPKTLLKELGPSTASTEIRGGTRRIITSTTVNLRETPSVSGKILGVADGGTRMVADGTIQSEGEDWMRVPIDGQTTVFIMSRFTTADDDGSGGDGIEGNAQAAIGVRGFATQIANVQATPLPEARIVRALQLEEEVRIIGQTNAGRAWYVLRLTDGSQGFAPREAIRLDPNASRWVYPDGTPALGPNIPKGSTTPLSVEAIEAARVARQKARSRTSAPVANNNSAGQTGSIQAVPNETSVTVEPEPQPVAPPPEAQPKEALPAPGPQ
jgi:hypothetical protein